ncbi:transmembrane channel-like protein 5 isoform X2 [Prorops nasuta]|uniref:transmembrane channel-like protein 5 isoform X2 n=1 Tax=Prorops nasuta TaxID=863751 RepID=UPI0034CE5249
MTDLLNLDNIVHETDVLNPSLNQSVQDLTCTILAISDRYENRGSLDSNVPYTTLCTRRKTSHLPLQEHAEAIADRLQLSNNLMKDDSTVLRMEILRAMPQCLAVKKIVLLRLQDTINLQLQKSKNTFYQSIKQKCSFFIMKNQFGSGIVTYFKFLQWLILLNLLPCILSFMFIIIPQSLENAYSPNNFNAWDLLTGSGFFTKTIFYYGFYSNNVIENIFGNFWYFPTAYFMTLFCCYILTFTVVSYKVVVSYKRCYAEIAGGVHNMYTNKIFCGWDFSISSSKLAKLWSASIYRELMENLSESERQLSLHFFTKAFTFFIRIVITIIVLSIICGAGAMLWIMLNNIKMEETDPLSIMIVPLTITGMMNILPLIISWLARFENYATERARLYMTGIRIYIMAAVLIGLFLRFVLINKKSGCWETFLGQEIYRLVIIDFCISIVGVYLTQVARSVWYKNFSHKVQRAKFDVAQNTLNLVYNQILFWISLYFSPLTSILIIMKMVITLYIKKNSLLKHYQPPLRSWKAAQTQTLFLALVFLGMVGVLILLGYSITKVENGICGPFQNYTYTWDFFINDILAVDKDSMTWTIVTQLTRPGIFAAVLISMSTCVYFLRAKTLASIEMVQILRKILIMQEKDKKFLLNELLQIHTRELHNKASTSDNESYTDSQSEVPSPEGDDKEFVLKVEQHHSTHNEL